MRYLICITFALFLICCSDNSSTIDIKPFKQSVQHPTDSSTLYFPLKQDYNANENWFAIVGLDSFVNSWFSAQLFAMQEPVLSSGHPEQEVYRFTWLRTFHNPISIRAEMQNERYYIIKKMANGAGGYDPGKLVVSEVKQISPAQWKQLLRKLDRSKFWRLSTNDPNINRLGTDGAE